MTIFFTILQKHLLLYLQNMHMLHLFKLSSVCSTAYVCSVGVPH